MNLLDNITLIIPAHYGEKYLLRSLAYYCKFNIQIIIPDSYIKRFDIENSIYSDNIKIKYFHYPAMPFVEKIYSILPFIDTKYIFTSAEDDFIVLNSLKQCVSFLDQNIDYSCVEGNNIRYVYTEDIKSYPIDIENYNLDFTEDLVDERLKNNFEYYTQTFYGVTRLENYKDFINLYYKNRQYLENFIFVELLKSIIDIVNGKLRVLPIFYNAREYRENSWGAVGANINYLITQETYITEYNHFLRICSEYLKDKSSLSKLEINKIVKKYSSHHIPTKISLIRKIIHWILPIRIKKIIKNKNILKHIINRIKSVNKLSGYPYNSNNKDIEEFLNIKDYIFKYKI